MLPLSRECGMATSSWNAVFALRMRVSMSAIGSVMVMTVLLSRRGSLAGLWRRSWLPGGLGDARQLAGVRHLAQADPAQAELAVHRVRTPAALAAGVAAHGELRLRRRLLLSGFLCHQRKSPSRTGPAKRWPAFTPVAISCFPLCRGTGSRVRAAAPGPPRRWPRW